jgi:hypothetical protein
MQAEEVRIAIKALMEQAEMKKSAVEALKGTKQQISATGKLSRSGNKSRLIQIGMSLVLLPEPTPITPTIGACFIAAGAIQKGIQSRSIYLEDLPKTMKATLREIAAAKYDLQI